MKHSLFFGLFASIGVALYVAAERFARAVDAIYLAVERTCIRVFDLVCDYVPKLLPYDWFDVPLVSRLVPLGRALLFREDRRAHIVRLGQHG